MPIMFNTILIEAGAGYSSRYSRKESGQSIMNLGDVGSKTTCQVKEQMEKYVLDLKHYIKML